jgi:hypothetical protein
MNAADVMNEALSEVEYDSGPLVAALLAHGEQGKGVTIRADGGLVPELPDGHVRLADGNVYRVVVTAKANAPIRLVPVSAEAGDTP